MGNFTKRTAAMVAGSIFAVAGGTAAFAYAQGWFSGNGTVTAASSAILPVTATTNLGATSESRLFPGRTVPISAVTVTNPNDYPVQINAITVSALTTNKAGCGIDEADLSFGAVPAGTTMGAGQSANVPLGSITMAQTADPACAGASFTVTATLAGEIAG
jgi:hypothetical protein